MFCWYLQNTKQNIKMSLASYWYLPNINPKHQQDKTSTKHQTSTWRQNLGGVPKKEISNIALRFLHYIYKIISFLPISIFPPGIWCYKDINLTSCWCLMSCWCFVLLVFWFDVLKISIWRQTHFDVVFDILRISMKHQTRCH